MDIVEELWWYISGRLQAVTRQAYKSELEHIEAAIKTAEHFVADVCAIFYSTSTDN